MGSSQFMHLPTLLKFLIVINIIIINTTAIIIIMEVESYFDTGLPQIPFEDSYFTILYISWYEASLSHNTTKAKTI